MVLDDLRNNLTREMNDSIKRFFAGITFPNKFELVENVLSELVHYEYEKLTERLKQFSKIWEYIKQRSLEDMDYEDLFVYIREFSDFWNEAKSKKFLYKMLDCAYYEDVKEWLDKESNYRLN